MKSWSLLLLLLVSLPVSPAHAATVYTEAVQGDLSNTGATPTSLSFDSGSNQVSGTTGRSLLTGVDRDYFTFVVPIGYEWVALQMLPGTTIGGSFSFIGLQAGSQVTVPPSASDATGLLGWTHYSDGAIGMDLLPFMSEPNLGSSGFEIPLTAGAYAIWIQDVSTGSFDWGFDVVIAPAPEPSVGALLIVALLAGISRGRLTSRRILGG